MNGETPDVPDHEKATVLITAMKITSTSLILLICSDG